MTIKEFFKPTWKKIIVFAILIILLLLIGFFEKPLGENVMSMCGPIGIYNPILRPFAFLAGNIFIGFIN